MNDAMESRYELVQQRMQAASAKAKRNQNEVHLLAVSKGQSVDSIRQLYALGQRDFGENYADELQKKQRILQEACPLIRWHFIGQIQSNKIKKIASADFVHSISQEKQAILLAKHRAEKPLSVFVQVTLNEQAHRGGVSLTNLLNLVHCIQKLPELHLLGLMVVLPLEMEKNPEQGFAQVLKIQKTLKEEGVALLDLSMGMSQDFEQAIAFGATWVRIGTLLFGPRNI